MTSFHDKLAGKALLNGRTAKEFHIAAQRNANATWVCFAIAGLVWYFATWYWALIPFAFAVLSALRSISATMIETRLEKIERKFFSREGEGGTNGYQSTS